MTDITTQIAAIKAAAEAVAKLEVRLEIDHVYGMGGDRVEVAPEDRDRTPDGIRCRDATISLVKGRNAELSAQVKVLEEALGRLSKCDYDRPRGITFRSDGVPSKHDLCTHGVVMYEECGECAAEFARKALEDKA